MAENTLTISFERLKYGEAIKSLNKFSSSGLKVDIILIALFLFKGEI
jgi:hypothetical protein